MEDLKERRTDGQEKKAWNSEIGGRKSKGVEEKIQEKRRGGRKWRDKDE